MFKDSLQRLINPSPASSLPAWFVISEGQCSASASRVLHLNSKPSMQTWGPRHRQLTPKFQSSRPLSNSLSPVKRKNSLKSSTYLNQWTTAQSSSQCQQTPPLRPRQGPPPSALPLLQKPTPCLRRPQTLARSSLTSPPATARSRLPAARASATVSATTWIQTQPPLPRAHRKYA